MASNLIARRTHEAFAQPQDAAATIWRYMDLAKFIALVNSRSLHFACAIKLGDPFEGAQPALNAESWRQVIANAYAKLDNPVYPLFGDAKPTTLEERLTLLSKARHDVVSCTLVNCWHMSEFESAAMWKVYSSSAYAVAVKSTYQALENALPSWVNIGCVKYIDYEKDCFPAGNLLHAVMHKRKSFEHEKEVRAVFQDFSRSSATKMPPEDDHKVLIGVSDIGAALPIDVVSLVHEVRVSPFAPLWFYDVVASTTERFFPAMRVGQSSMSGSPVY